MIYLLTAIGLSHTNNTQDNTNNNRTTQITNNVEECGPCPVFASFTPAFALQLRKKARKNFSQVKKNLSQGNTKLEIYFLTCMMKYKKKIICIPILKRFWKLLSNSHFWTCCEERKTSNFIITFSRHCTKTLCPVLITFSCPLYFNP